MARDAAYDEYLKTWVEIGLHPEVVALQRTLQSEHARAWPKSQTIATLGEARYTQSVRDWMALRSKVDERAYELHLQFEAAGYPAKAFAPEALLSQAIASAFDPWASTFDLVFVQNCRFPPSFSVESDFFANRLNERQKKFIYIADWWNRVMNGGADPMFSDSTPDFITAWWALDVVGWPSFAGDVRRGIETVMRVTPDEIAATIAARGLIEAGYVLKARRFGDREGRLEEMTLAEEAACKELEALLFAQQEEFRARVLQAIWTHRTDLIQPPPEGLHVGPHA